jgi:hypothetical protein
VIALSVLFRSQGIQWPLKPDDRVFVYDGRTHDLLFVTTGELLITLLRHRLDDIAVQALVRDEMEHKEAPVEPAPVLDPPQREKLRARRLAKRGIRKPPRKMEGP